MLRTTRSAPHVVFCRGPARGLIRRGARGPSAATQGEPPRAWARYRFSGGIFRMGAENFACASRSTGLCLILVLAGSLPRKLSPFQFFDGLMGLGRNPPPQFGQTLPRTLSTHVAQNVHSYAQMRASREFGGRALLQCSQVGRSSSIVLPKKRRMWKLTRGGRHRVQRLVRRARARSTGPANEGPDWLREQGLLFKSLRTPPGIYPTSGAIPSSWSVLPSRSPR